MNFRILISAILLTSIFVLYGQNNKKNYFKVGPKLGLDLNADINNLPSGEEIIGQIEGNNQVGLFMQFGKRFYIQPELMYSVQNFTNEQGIRDNNKYLRIPLHAGIKFLDIGLFSLHVSGGALYTHKLESDAGGFSTGNINYQLGAGIDIFDFITTDIRYTISKGIPVLDQLSDFSSQGGIVNVTVGLKL